MPHIDATVKIDITQTERKATAKWLREVAQKVESRDYDTKATFKLEDCR